MLNNFKNNFIYYIESLSEGFYIHKILIQSTSTV